MAKNQAQFEGISLYSQVRRTVTDQAKNLEVIGPDGVQCGEQVR